MLIADYRFSFGLLVAANAGVWFRPQAEFLNVRIGDMGSFGVAFEQYVWQSKGISVIGEVYGYPSLTKFPDSPSQVPAEALLAIRWQGKHGISITAGGASAPRAASARPPSASSAASPGSRRTRASRRRSTASRSVTRTTPTVTG